MFQNIYLKAKLFFGESKDHFIFADFVNSNEPENLNIDEKIEIKFFHSNVQFFKLYFVQFSFFAKQSREYITDVCNICWAQRKFIHLQMFVMSQSVYPGKLLKHSLMFANEARAYPELHLSGVPLLGRLLALPTNVRLGL